MEAPQGEWEEVMGRQNGFYWVRLDDGWTVANWDGARWWMIGSEMSCKSTDFDEIDERRIERAEEVK
jgi:hypothetical protein